jgi:hypothetical protein
MLLVLEIMDRQAKMFGNVLCLREVGARLPVLK